MRYANTAVAVTHLGDYIYDRELPEPDDGISEGDDDHSDEQFDRMDRNNEPRGW